MLDTLQARLRRHKTERAGLDHVIYDRFSRSGMRVNILIAGWFNADGAVIQRGRRGHLPGTRCWHGCAHPARWSLFQLGQGDRNLDAWCASQAHRLAGMSWEVDGKWQDDPAKLVTDRFFRLAS